MNSQIKELVEVIEALLIPCERLLGPCLVGGEMTRARKALENVKSPSDAPKPSQDASHEEWQEFYRVSKIKRECFEKASEYWPIVFHMLDSEIDTEEAASIAKSVQDQVEQFLIKESL